MKSLLLLPSPHTAHTSRTQISRLCFLNISRGIKATLLIDTPPHQTQLNSTWEGLLLDFLLSTIFRLHDAHDWYFVTKDMQCHERNEASQEEGILVIFCV